MGIKPWEWDYEHYGLSEDDREMVGFFYPEDVANLEQIDHYKRQYTIRHRPKQ